MRTSEELLSFINQLSQEEVLEVVVLVLSGLGTQLREQLTDLELQKAAQLMENSLNATRGKGNQSNAVTFGAALGVAESVTSTYAKVLKSSKTKAKKEMH